MQEKIEKKIEKVEQTIGQVLKYLDGREKRDGKTGKPVNCKKSVHGSQSGSETSPD